MYQYVCLHTRFLLETIHFSCWILEYARAALQVVLFAGGVTCLTKVLSLICAESDAESEAVVLH